MTGSARDSILDRARAYLIERERHTIRLPAVEQLAAQLADALADHPHDPRTLVLALRVLDQSHAERRHIAQVLRSTSRQAAAAVAGRARAAAVTYDPATVRAWALEQNLDVPRVGRYLPDDVVVAWREAHQ